MTLQNRMGIIKTNLEFIQNEVDEGDDKCYELLFSKEQSEIRPFEFNGSEAKKTQKAYQLLNSAIYEQLFMSEEETPLKDADNGASGM